MTSPTIKQQRDAKRAQKVAAFNKQQAATKRNRRIGLIVAIVAVVAIIAVIATVLLVNSAPKPEPEAIEPTVKTWEGLEATHVEGKVDYEMSPPAGGPHNAAWLNCGVYTRAQSNESAVHSLEHGAVWATYNPDFVDDEELAELQALLPDTYSILSPYPDLDAAMAVSAWGAQIKFSDPSAREVSEFIEQYWQSADAPEPGAPCTGAIDGPGKVE